jgi:hypothetical protein
VSISRLNVSFSLKTAVYTSPFPAGIITIAKTQRNPRRQLFEPMSLSVAYRYVTVKSTHEFPVIAMWRVILDKSDNQEDYVLYPL